MKFEMNPALPLFLSVLFQATTGKQKTSGAILQCSDYLRCRSDELEVLWKCVDDRRSLLNDVCRIERHIRSLKALVMRRESDFAGCVATRAHSIEDSGITAEALCSERLTIPARPSCDELTGVTASPCEALRKCCTVSKTCEEEQHDTTISLMLTTQKTTVGTLLQGCRSTLETSSASNQSRNASDMTAKRGLKGVTSVMDLIEGLEEFSDKGSHESLKKDHENVLTTSTNGSSTNHTKPPSWPIAARMEAEIRRSQVKTEYRNRASSMNNRYPAKLFAAPRYQRRRESSLLQSNNQQSPVVTIDRETSNVDGTASMIRIERLRQLMSQGDSHQRGFVRVPVAPLPSSPMLSPHQVNVIIDRTLQDLFHPPPIPPIPQKEYSTVDGFIERSHAPIQPTSPAPARESHPATTTFPNPDSSTLAPFFMFRRPFRLPKVDAEHSPTIRRPWSTQSKPVSRGRYVWKGTSKQKQKHFSSGLSSKKLPFRVKGPWAGRGSAKAIRTGSSFRDEFVTYPRNMEVLTDIAIPYRNRLKTKLRFKVIPQSRISEDGDAVENASRPMQVFTSSRTAAFRGPEEDAIYEDILHQERKLLSERNAPLPPDYEVDFDDTTAPLLPQEFDMTPPPFVVFTQHKSKTGLTRPKINLKVTPGRAFLKRHKGETKNGKVFTRVVSVKSGLVPTTTPPSEMVPLLATTDNPLDGAILEELLTNSDSDGMRHIIPTVKLLEVKQLDQLDPLENFNKTATFRPETPPELSTTEPITDNLNQSTSSQSTTTVDMSFDITDPMTFRAPSFYYETKAAEDTTEPAATIIPTMKNPYWTRKPDSNGFHVEVIPFPKSNPVDGPLIAVDKFVDITLHSTTPLVTTMTPFPTLIESSESIEPPLPQGEVKRARMMAAKTVRSVSQPVDVSSNKSTSTDDVAEAVSVLKLSETTVKLSHCEVYALCLDEFSREEKLCGTTASRVLPTGHRIQRTSCKRKLLPDYKAVDDETRSLEEIYNACIKIRLGMNITDVEATQCAAQSLPSSLENEPCHSKVYVLKQHCSRLAKCCPDAQICRNEIDRSDRSRYLRRRKESLAVAATKCRLQRYREILKRPNLLHPESPLSP